MFGMSWAKPSWQIRRLEGLLVGTDMADMADLVGRESNKPVKRAWGALFA